MTVKTVLDKIARGEDACVCCVGDSVTYGVIHCRPEETYTAKLAAAFAGQYRTCTVLRYDGIYHDDNGNCPLDAYDGPVLVQAGTAGCLTVVRSGVGGDTVARLCNRADDFTVKLPGGMRPDLMTVMAVRSPLSPPSGSAAPTPAGNGTGADAPFLQRPRRNRSKPPGAVLRLRQTAGKGIRSAAD